MSAWHEQVTRRWLLGALAAAGAGPALAQAPSRSLLPRPRPGQLAAASSAQQPPPPGAADLIAGARLGGTVAFALADGATGKLLESRHADQPLPPGSVTKIFTTLYALEHLGPDHRFATRLVATGPVAGGRIQGDLILLGGGDPTLDTDALGDMAAALAAKGVKGATGRFFYDARALPELAEIDPGQPPAAGYDPGLSGLNLNFNRVYFTWTRAAKGYALSMDARGRRYLPAVSGIRMGLSGRNRPVYTHSSDAGGERWTVAASALGRRGARWLPVREPARYTAEVFRTLAASQSIALSPPAAGAVPNGAAVLVTHLSDPLTDVLREMLKYSTNLTAESVGLAASAAANGGRAPATLAASAHQMTAWAQARFGIEAQFGDHSGLGPKTRVTATDLVQVLSSPAARTTLRPLLKEVPLRDARGRPVKDSPLTIKAKTGTLNFVSGLAGYVMADGGQDLIFAILTADVPRHNAVPANDRGHPAGQRAWVHRARSLQLDLIARWGALYTASG